MTALSSLLRTHLNFESARNQHLSIRALGLALLLAGGASYGHADVKSRFIGYSNYSAGGSPTYTVSGDFNNDGKLDLVASDSNGRLTILLGNGHGGFASPVTILTAPHGAAQVVAGDFNHDGNLDLVFLPLPGTRVMLLRGNGNGTFQPPVSFPDGTTSASASANDQLKSGDVNGDGKPDLIIGTPSGINVLLNNGTGGFGTAKHTDTAVSSTNSFFTTGDFNNDGRLDVVLGDYQGDLQALLGHGDGTFNVLSEVSGDPFANTSYIQVVAADLNGDGKLDLVFAQAGNNFPDGVGDGGFAVVLGHGDGTFDPLANSFLMQGAFMIDGIAVADVNGDGKPDVLMRNTGASALTVSLNDGTGTFPGLTEYSVNRGPRTITPGDFTGDGRVDIAAGGLHGVSMLVNLGNGVLRAPLTLDGGQFPVAATTADMNRDGLTDIALISAAQPFRVPFGQAYAFLGMRTGTFGLTSATTNLMSNSVVAVGDMNHDGFGDILTTAGNTLEVEFFTPSGGLKTGPDTTLPTTPLSMVAGNFDAGGNGDVAYVDGTGLQVLLGNGDGTFKTPVAYGVGTNPVFVAIRDVNHDGKSDLLVVNQGSNDVSVLLGTGTGTFGPAHNFAAGVAPAVLTTGDFNRDGKIDLAVANQTNVAILLGNGSGTFGTFHNFPAGVAANSISQASFEKLGFEDIVVGGGQSFFILPSNGDGTFQAPVLFSGGSVNPVETLTGDFNGDGAPDLALWNQGSMGTVIMFNQSGVQVKLTSSLNPSHHGNAVTFTATAAPSFPGNPTPTGTIAFKDGNTVLALVALTGGHATHSTSALSVGTHSITATYYGSNQSYSAKSPVVAQEVNP